MITKFYLNDNDLSVGDLSAGGLITNLTDFVGLNENKFFGIINPEKNGHTKWIKINLNETIKWVLGNQRPMIQWYMIHFV